MKIRLYTILKQKYVILELFYTIKYDFIFDIYDKYESLYTKKNGSFLYIIYILSSIYKKELYNPNNRKLSSPSGVKFGFKRKNDKKDNKVFNFLVFFCVCIYKKIGKKKFVCIHRKKK